MYQRLGESRYPWLLLRRRQSSSLLGCLTVLNARSTFLVMYQLLRAPVSNLLGEVGSWLFLWYLCKGNETSGGIRTPDINSIFCAVSCYAIRHFLSMLSLLCLYPVTGLYSIARMSSITPLYTCHLRVHTHNIRNHNLVHTYRRTHRDIRFSVSTYPGIFSLRINRLHVSL